MERIKRILIISSDKGLRDVLSFCFDGWGYEVSLCDHTISDIESIKRISPDVIVVDVHDARKSQLEICRLLKDDFITAFIPIITIINKRQLRQQLLEIRQGVDDYLIKPPDPLDLRVRIEMAIKRNQYSLYTSPLTGLPGGRIIEEVLRNRIKADCDFSFGYADIDNFKYFNDVYGYLKGDRVIMQTAYILYSAIKRYGKNEDFIGHIGGDDFVFITDTDRYEDICQNFIRLFDSLIPFHYCPQDRERGFIIAKDRTNKIKKISLMGLSIAVVNRIRPLNMNIIEINDRLAEIKRYLKTMPGSKFMADRRNFKTDNASNASCFSQKDRCMDSYKPIGQILLDAGVITPEQLDEALSIHWKRGVILGEVMKELGFLEEDDLIEALNIQAAKGKTYGIHSE